MVTRLVLVDEDFDPGAQCLRIWVDYDAPLPSERYDDGHHCGPGCGVPGGLALVSPERV